MKQVYHLDDYLKHEESKTLKDRFLYLSLSLRPASTLIICIILTVITAIPCIILMICNPATSVAYNIAFAIFTGVVASGLVSIVVELAANYRHNYQRLLVLHEYLLTVANYEKHIEFCKHGRTDEDCPGDFTARTMAAAEIILEIGPVIEAAYKDGKEFMSLEEMKYVISAVEAASRIGEIADSFAYDQMTERDRIGDFYERLSDPFKTRLLEFADEVGISIIPNHLDNIVADYVLEHPEELEELDQYDLYRALYSFDDAMTKLQNFIKNEPGYHVELIPWEQRVKKIEKKFKKEHEKVEKKTLEKLQKAVEEGYITKAEYEEFLQLDEESSYKDLDMDKIYKEAGVDYTKATSAEELDAMDEKVDAVMEETVNRRTEEQFKKMMRAEQILAKAEGRNLELTSDMWVNKD